MTGGGSGIGRAVARGLAHDRYSVVIVGRRLDALRDTAAGAGHRGVILPVAADVTDPQQVAAVFAFVKESFGRLDLLFNNAGAWAAQAAIEDIELADWHQVIAVNLTGAFLCTQQAIRLMKEQEPGGGRIINNGSIAAQVPRPLSAAYAAAKSGITGLTKATALEGRPYSIACGQIDVGNTRTDRTVDQAVGVLQPDGSVRVEPTMDVANVVNAVVMMAGLPLDANVQSMTLIATAMPLVGRG